MSGALEEILARPMGIDYLTPLEKWAQINQGNAQVQQTNAQTGLIGQQAQGAGLQNQLARLNLGLRTAMVAPFLPGGATGGAGAPPPGPGGAAAPTSYLPTGQGGAAPVAPVASAPLGPPPPAAGDAGGGATAAPTAATHSTGMPPPGQPIGQPIGPYGAVQTMYGVPLPAGQTMAVLSAADPSAALKSAMEMRRQRLLELMSQPDWSQGVTQAYQEGWMDPQHYQAMVGQPQMRQAALMGLASPDAYMSALDKFSGMGMTPDANAPSGLALSPTAIAAKGAVAASEAGGRSAGELTLAQPLAAARALGAGQAETTQVTIPDPDNPGQFRTDTVLKSALPAYMGANPGARQASAADLANGNVTLGPAAYAARVTQRENAGGPPGATNPLSSAAGNGQFTDGTWLATVAAAKPPWAQGMSDAQILAARADPQKAAQMSYALAQQNAPKLTAAGLPVNSLTLGLAHQFGPDGVTKVMGSPPDTPLSKVVSPEVMAANPQFARMTTGQASAQAFQTYGLNNVDLNQPIGAAAPPTQIAPGSAPGVPKLGPQGTAALGVTTDAIKSDAGSAEAAINAAQSAQKAQGQLLNVRSLIPDINTGSLANASQSVQNYLATFAPDAAQRFAAAITAGKIDPSKAGATQEFVKLTLQQAGMAERETLGARGGLGAIQLYQKSFPNLEMQPTAIKDMTNLLLVAHQRDIDYGTGANGYFLNNSQAFSGGGQYNRLGNYDQGFLQSNPPQVYVGAAAALNGKPFEQWAHAMTPAQQQEAIRTVWRADPTAVLTGPGGAQYRNPALATQ